MARNSSRLTHHLQEGVLKSRCLDVVTVGRCSVDLYGVEIGSRLEDVDTFRKSVGGCPANIAIGCARLGLKSALLTRVGDEQMGRFIIAEMEREGVSTGGIVLDDGRLTALVLLAVRNRRQNVEQEGFCVLHGFTPARIDFDGAASSRLGTA